MSFVVITAETVISSWTVVLSMSSHGTKNNNEKEERRKSEKMENKRKQKVGIKGKALKTLQIRVDGGNVGVGKVYTPRVYINVFLFPFGNVRFPSECELSTFAAIFRSIWRHLLGRNTRF